MDYYQIFKQELIDKNVEVYRKIKREWFDQPDEVFEDMINRLREETINMNYGSNSNEERRAIEKPIFNDDKYKKLDYLNKYSNTFLIFFLKLFGDMDKLMDIMTQDILEHFYNIFPKSNIDEIINNYKVSDDFLTFEENNFLILYSNRFYNSGPERFFESLNELRRSMINFTRNYIIIINEMKNKSKELFNHYNIPDELSREVFQFFTSFSSDENYGDPNNTENDGNFGPFGVYIYDGNDDYGGGKIYKKIRNKRKTNKKVVNKRKTSKNIKNKRKNNKKIKKKEKTRT